MGDLAGTVGPALARGECEHMAVLIDSVADLPPLLVSFYELGARHNGWLVHGSLPGEAENDRQKLLDAGLDVERLEADGQLAVQELDLTVAPEEWVQPWSDLLDARLASGFHSLWFARFPVGPTDDEVDDVLPFEAAWMARFRGRPVVTLCPYIVGAVPAAHRGGHGTRVSTVHDRLLDVTAAS